MDTQTIISFSIAIVSLILTIIQTLKLVKLKNIYRTDIAEAINRTKMMIITNKDASEILKNSKNPKITAWIWKRQRGISDLYVSLVRQYVSSMNKFKYSDIKKLIDSGLIETRWQESIWREIIALRKENLKYDALPNILTDEKPNEWGEKEKNKK